MPSATRRPGITVSFSVSGANTAGGSDETDTAGEASFCYTGTVAGLDTITAFADTNGDGDQDLGEPGRRGHQALHAGRPGVRHARSADRREHGR